MQGIWSWEIDKERKMCHDIGEKRLENDWEMCEVGQKCCVICGKCWNEKNKN